MTAAPRLPILADPDRLTVAAKRVAAKLSHGERLCKQFVADERCPRGVSYFLEPGGRKVLADAAEELIAKGKVRPLRDGLFGDGDAQTFEAAP